MQLIRLNLERFSLCRVVEMLTIHLGRIFFPGVRYFAVLLTKMDYLKGFRINNG